MYAHLQFVLILDQVTHTHTHAKQQQYAQWPFVFTQKGSHFSHHPNQQLSHSFTTHITFKTKLHKRSILLPSSFFPTVAVGSGDVIEILYFKQTLQIYEVVLSPAEEMWHCCSWERQLWTALQNIQHTRRRLHQTFFESPNSKLTDIYQFRQQLPRWKKLVHTGTGKNVLNQQALSLC